MTTIPVRGLCLAALLSGLAEGPGARGQNGDPGVGPTVVTHHAEGPPRVQVFHGPPRPVLGPGGLPNFGYFPTGWQRWPGPADPAPRVATPGPFRVRPPAEETGKLTAPPAPEAKEAPRYLPHEVPVSKPAGPPLRPISAKEPERAAPPVPVSEPERAAPPPVPGYVPPVPTELPEDLKPVSYAPPAAPPPAGRTPEPPAPGAPERRPAGGGAAGGPPLKMVNSRRISLDCDTADLGGTNSTLELWYTRDGRSWARDAGGRAGSPYVVEVDREGTYGFRMVARPAGEKSVPPAAGAEPQVWIEVDCTRPVVQLIDARAGVDRRLQLLWTANDANLARQPITLSYAPAPQGPWKSFAAGLENTGRFTWQVPGGLPAQVYLKVEASDLAGNVGTAVTPVPVRLP